MTLRISIDTLLCRERRKAGLSLASRGCPPLVGCSSAAAPTANFDWANPTAVCYVCDRCGYIHWFLPRR